MHIRLIKAHHVKTNAVIPITDALYLDEHTIMASCHDGMTKVWDLRSQAFKPSTQIYTHQENSDVSSLTSFEDTKRFILRDKSLKLFDLRQPDTCIEEWSEYPNPNYPKAKVCLSPDEQVMLVPVSKQNGYGKLAVIDLASFDEIGEIKYPGVDAISAMWVKEINQIFVSLSSGSIEGYFTPELS